MRSSTVVYVSIATGRSIKYLLDTVLYDYLKASYTLRIFSPFSEDNEFVRKYGGEGVRFSKHPCTAGKARIIIRKIFDRFRFLWPIFRLKNTPLGDELSFTRKRIYPLGYEITKVLHTFIKALGGWSAFKKLARYVYFSDYYFKYFYSESPKLVVLPSPSKVVGDYCLQCAAAVNHVPTCLIPSSWDDFTTGGEFPFESDLVLSWGPEMSRHAREFFGFQEDKLVNVGLIRMETVQTPMNEKAFRKRMKIPEGFRIILFPTNQHYIMAPEPRILEELIHDVESGKIGDVVVIVRPNNTSGPFQKEYIRKYKDHPLVRINIPEEDGVGRYSEDETRWVDVLANVDVVITICSMMVLEAFYFNKPVINLNYDYGMMGDWGYSYKFYYGREVYRKIREYGATRFVDSRQELISAINRYLSYPGLDQEARSRVMKLWDVTPLHGKTRSQIAFEAIQGIVDGKKTIG